MCLNFTEYNSSLLPAPTLLDNMALIKKAFDDGVLSGLPTKLLDLIDN